MYFIIVLIELTLVTPALIRLIETKYKYLALTISPLYLIRVYYQEFYCGEVYFTIGRNLIAWLSFYYLGLLISKQGFKVPKVLLTWGVVIMGILSVTEAMIILVKYNNPDFAASQLKMSSYLLAVDAILLEEYIHSQYRQISANWLSAIGDYSYGIFFIQPFIIKIENAFAKRTIFYDISLPIYEIAQCILTVAICCEIIYVVRRIDSKNRIRWMIGL